MKNFKKAFAGWGLSWSGAINNTKGEWWLIGQLLILVAHLFVPYISPKQLNVSWPIGVTSLGGFIFFLGIFRATKALIALGSSLSPLPDPKPGASLVTNDLYSQCRHPLYQALVLCSSGLTLGTGSVLYLFLLISLASLLTGKAK